MIQNIVANSGFESGSLTPWSSNQASVTTNEAHTGNYAALLNGGVNSFIYQTVSVTPGDSYELKLSVAKIGVSTAPLISISVQFYNANLAFLSYGLINSIRIDSLPAVQNDTWKTVYNVTAPAPPNAAYARVLINSIGIAGNSSVLVDDVQLVTAQSTQVSACAPSFPLLAQKLQTLMGQSVTIFTGFSLSAFGTVEEVTDEYVRIVDSGVSDLFPYASLYAIEYS
ncbi:NTTRR-F1 domain [Paenibacillus caui]|uniref:NTTRR-F1 domain n=1 Tax=Paenibacillus caui TaxID=2873927 RepID=UPI001F340925|nr:NTTRR-F1 domain [Paenibacillus caui]